MFCDALLYASRGDYLNRNHILPKLKTIQSSFTSHTEEFHDTTPWDQRTITPLGVIFLLDVLDNDEKWKKHKIDFNTLPKNHPLNKSIQEIKNLRKLYPDLANEDIKIQIFKILLYQNCKKQNETLAHLILTSTIAVSKLTFKKILKKDCDAFSRIPEKAINSVYLSFDGLRIDLNPKANITIITKMLEDIARKEIASANKKDITHFQHAILHLHFNKADAIRYVKNKRDSEDENKAQFLSKPTLWGWVKLNPLKSILLIPLLYGCYKTYEQNKLNQKPVEAAATEAPPKIPNIKHIIIPKSGISSTPVKNDKEMQKEKERNRILAIQAYFSCPEAPQINSVRKMIR